MSAFEQLAMAGEALGLALRRLLDRTLWAPWLALAVVELATLGALLGFAHPALSWLMAPLVRAGGGEAALHYPGFYLVLPSLARRAGLLLALLPGAVAAGWSTWLFAARWRELPVRAADGWNEAWSRAAALVLAQLPFTVLAAVGPWWIARSLAHAPGLVRRLGDLTGLGVATTVQALALFLPALVVIERRGARSAWAALPRTWSRGLWAALPIACAAVLVRLPLDRLPDAGLAAASGDPERVAWRVVARVLLALVPAFVVAGGATLAYLGAVAPEDGA